ncbi:MAG: hypothetical protein N2578_00620 [Bdellovibrionaceae bacterium]|nr:hypothetical protein [Pseudobdellovibrionaceae bacterium]
MRPVWILRTMISILFFLSLEMQARQGSSVLTFKEWKAHQIYVAERRLSAHKERLSKKYPSRANQYTISDEVDLAIARESLALARNLTIEDYMVGYLGRMNPSSDFYERLALEMSPSQTAQLLRAYRESLNLNR